MRGKASRLQAVCSLKHMFEHIKRMSRRAETVRDGRAQREGEKMVRAEHIQVEGGDRLRAPVPRALRGAIDDILHEQL